jgi:hypothetical protein
MNLKPAYNIHATAIVKMMCKRMCISPGGRC